jgi:hypothetical protein
LYRALLKYIKEYLPRVVTVEPIQTGYLGDYQNIDLRIPAVLLEPKTDRRSQNNTRWDNGDFLIKLWIMLPFDLDYESSMDRMENLLAAADDQWSDVMGEGLMEPAAPNGIYSALNQLKKLDEFRNMSGSFGGVSWRIREQVLSYNNVTFSVSQRASQKINITQLDLTIYLNIER